MSYPVFHIIRQGETLVFELRLVGEDLADATPRVETSAGMPPVNFTATKVLADTLQIKAVSTDEFAEGVHDLVVWLDWSSGDVASEVIHEGKVRVLDGNTFWDFGTGIIDGGMADTIHEDVLSGGGP